jgi:hypothetical protein
MSICLSLRKRIAFVCVVIFLTFLILESMARLFIPYTNTEPVVPNNIKQFDPTLGWAYKPNSSGISINSKGLRDNETDYKKPEGIFRIVLLGDSFTFGFGVPIEKHFSTILEGYFQNVEVINMGVSGFGVDQELIYLQEEGFRYEPDLVIAFVATYGDHRHMHNLRFGKAKPRFLLVEGKLTLTDTPVIASEQPWETLRTIHALSKKASKIYAILYDRLKSIIRLPQVYPKYPSDEENSNDDEFMKTLHQLGERLVFMMHKESLKHGAKFVLVTRIPKLYEASLEQGIYVLNVSAALRNNKFKLPDNLLHINESGNGVLAWELAQFLKKK